ncbi:splicing factor 1, partial [Cyanistes caeruleus]|uniref:splicing factor 1 n=1 Tax=Cyanistes caeruleus TaxID=156563 RepID=UPI000CDB785D
WVWDPPKTAKQSTGRDHKPRRGWRTGGLRASPAAPCLTSGSWCPIPRGNTLKNIEKECNAKIMIRGKGSVKEGKVGRKDGQMLPGEDEPLHALVTANTMENVKKAVEQIRNILKQGIETPEDQNDLRKMQLRELARLNGTLREDDNRILRPWQSTETRSITNTTVCTKCGGAGHIASDCKFARPGDPQSAQDKARMDKEYLSLMAELGEAPVSVSSNAAHNNSPLSSSHRAASQAGGQPPPVSDTPKIPPLGAPRAHLKQPKISPSSSPGQ